MPDPAISASPTFKAALITKREAATSTPVLLAADSTHGPAQATSRLSRLLRVRFVLKPAPATSICATSLAVLKPEREVAMLKSKAAWLRIGAFIRARSKSQ